MNLLKRCWKNRWIRLLVWAIMPSATLFVLLSGWLNRRWGQRWVATCEMLKAEGETVDFRALVMQPIAEADNFCAIPLLKEFTADYNAATGVPASHGK